MQLYKSKIRDFIHNFLYNTGYKSDDFKRDMNELLDQYTGSNLILVNRRDSSKIVSGFGVSSNPDKIIVRYLDGPNGSMLIKNLLNNLIIHEKNVWDDPSEDDEHDFLLERLGIKI